MPDRRLLAVLLLLLACRTAAPVAGMPGNFGIVEEGRIYRGAQPSTSDLESLARAGVRTILKLNGDHLEQERADAARLGLRLVYVPLNARTVGTAGECNAVEKAYAALTDAASWPIFVHCTHGRDRTGFLVGLFRERADGWSWPQVRAELSKYGHGTFWRTVFPNISTSLETGAPVCAGSRLAVSP